MTAFDSDTDLVYLRDVDVRTFEAVVVGVDGQTVALDRTAFYPTGGGQPHDVGTLAGSAVVGVRKGPSPDGSRSWVWHELDGPVPGVGDTVTGIVDDSRRHHLMRTHTAMHILCGVIWNEWKVPVTGGNMEPLSGRMDFEFDPVPEGFAARIEELVNAEIVADRPVRVEFLPRDTALQDADLIRTKVSLIPESVSEIRVVDIVGLDKQADGGTHVHSTSQVGRVKVTKVENKGKGNKRVRIEILDA
jgi:misacylated tRNA(Ala) deacylase